MNKNLFRPKILIVDDERNARLLLSDLISELGDYEIIGSVDNVDDAFNEVKQNSPDAVLLDIQMPEKDGFELIEMFQALEFHPAVIFITAYEDYTIKAIRSAAFDYLLKPVSKEDLSASLERLRLKTIKENKNPAYEVLLNSLQTKKKIRLNDRTGFNLLDPENIIFIRASGNYSEFIMSQEPNKTICLNIGKVEQELNHNSFLRISRSCIINADYLVRVDRKKMICELRNDEVYECKVSKNYFKNIEILF